MDDFLRKGRMVQDPTSITLVNNTAKTEDITVPPGQRWLLLGIRISNPDDVARDVYVTKLKEAAKTTKIRNYAYGYSLGAGAELNIPGSGSSNYRRAFIFPDIYVAGNTLSITWAAGGASTGGTDADGITIEYLVIVS